MSGYCGWSMSNNAIEAYDRGEMPKSKWTKALILESIEDAVSEKEIELKCSFGLLSKVKRDDLRDICLEYAGWHHTGKYYQETDFYCLNLIRIEELTDAELNQIIDKAKLNKPLKEEVKEEHWRCSYLIWSGTRKHPYSKRVVDEGIIRGNWFYLKDGHKKSIYAKGFQKIERLDVDEPLYKQNMEKS